MKTINVLTTLLVFVPLMSPRLIYAESVRSRPSQKISLIQSEDVDAVTYKAFLKTEPSYIAFSEAWIRVNVPRQARLELRRLFEEAEGLFLSSSPAKARDAYLRVAELAPSQDWGLVQRKIIFHSFLRAAQISTSQDERQSLLIQAIQFDEDEEADTDLFPPPLVAELVALRKEYGGRLVSVNQALREYDFALINGKRVSLQRKTEVKVPSGAFRLTLVSNRYAPITKHLSGDEMQTWRPVRVSLAKGSCSDPQFHPSTEGRGVRALFAGECMASNTKVALDTSKDTKINNSRSQDIKAWGSLKYDKPFDPLKGAQQNKLSQPLYRNKWFWILSGTAVAVIVANNQKRGSAPPPPTVKDGF